MKTKLPGLFLLALTLTIVLVLTMASSVNAQKEPGEALRPLDGTFIQLWASRDDKKMWDEVLGAMKAAKIKTIVIQYLQSRSVKLEKGQPVLDKNGRPVLDVNDFYSSEKHEAPDVQNGVEYVDSTEYILQFAEDNGMQVYVGLIYDARFVVYGQWDNPKILDLPQQTVDGVDFIQKVWDRYGKRPSTGKPYKSFAGWYIASEMWNMNYSDDYIKEFRKYFKALSAKCKSFGRERLIAVSPFLNFTLLNAKEFAATYGKFLGSGDESAGIDIVMLQDSVGAKHKSENEVRSFLTPFYTELRNELNKTKDKPKTNLWANVESFEGENESSYEFKPTEFSRFETQIRTAADVLKDKQTEQIITFDFFHYMNPYGHYHNKRKDGRKYDGPEYTASERKLYCDYISKFKLSPPKGIVCANK